MLCWSHVMQTCDPSSLIPLNTQAHAVFAAIGPSKHRDVGASARLGVINCQWHTKVRAAKRVAELTEATSHVYPFRLLLAADSYASDMNITV
jgi:hypothetical protein